MAEFETLSLSIKGGCARLRLTRAELMNALSLTTLEELLGATEVVQKSPDVRVLVLEGEGRAFSVGFDLRSLGKLFADGQPPSEEVLKEAATLGERVLSAVGDLNAVTIASLHGFVIGGGFLLAAACDFRIASESTVFSLPEIDIGLPLSWNGVPLLARELGPSLARDLVMTGRKIGAESLGANGFLHACVAPDARDERVAELAAELGAKPAWALRQTKHQFRALRRGEAVCDAELFAEAIMQPAFMPTAMAYLERLRSKSKSGD